MYKTQTNIFLENRQYRVPKSVWILNKLNAEQVKMVNRAVPIITHFVGIFEFNCLSCIGTQKKRYYFWFVHVRFKRSLM